jgi:hypothetical protein
VKSGRLLWATTKFAANVSAPAQSAWKTVSFIELVYAVVNPNNIEE